MYRCCTMTKQIRPKQKAFIMGDDYSLFPQTEMRFEMTIPQDEPSWGFFASRRYPSNIHIRFTSTSIDEDA